jgi:C1A family cysteine protease
MAFATNQTRDSTDMNIWKQFNYFQNNYHKEYETLVELERRFQIFAENFRAIVSHNSNPNRTFTLNVNRFTDLTPEEFQATYVSGYIGAKNLGSFGCKTFSSIEYPEFASVDAVPDSVDWREKRVVNSVRDQGQCGSCWAFAVAGAIESYLTIKNGRRAILSTQQFVDCASDESPRTLADIIIPK